MLTELAYRVSDGISVALLWQRETNEICVEVFDNAAGGHFSFSVLPDRAMDAFHHPYAYAAQRGIRREADSREAIHV